MNKNPLVSVIVPVYNVEKYLDRCMISILDQSYNNLEIILVDDGSTDNCPNICDTYCEKDQRVRVIHKKNGGLGFARNSGLEVATGKYVSFIDSDDYIEKNMYELIVDKLESSKADVCYFDFQYDKDGKISSDVLNFPDDMTEEQIISELLPISFGKSISKVPDPYGIGSVCAGVYRLELFNFYNLRFESERECLSEDILFTSQFLLHIKKAVFLNKGFYHYCYNEDSLTHSYRLDRFEKTKAFYNMQKQIIDENKLPQLALKRAKNTFFINCIVCIKQECLRKDALWKEKKQNLTIISDDELFREIYKEYSICEFNSKKRLLFMFMYHKFMELVFLLVKLKSQE